MPRWLTSPAWHFIFEPTLRRIDYSVSKFSSRTRATGVAETVAGSRVSKERWLMTMSRARWRGGRAARRWIDDGDEIAVLNRLPKRDLVLEKADDLASEHVFDTDIEMALGR